MPAQKIQRSAFIFISSVFFLLIPLLQPPVPAAEGTDVLLLPNVEDRSTGSEGAEKTADYILGALKEYGLDEVGVQEFDVPEPSAESASVKVHGISLELHSWGPNLVYLSTTPPGGIRAPLVYGGRGGFTDFDGKPVAGSIVLLDMNSGGTWLNAASLGAAAVIFIGSPDSLREEYQQKNTTAPLAFPRYWADIETGEKLKQEVVNGPVEGILESRTSWRTKTIRNCYGLLRGRGGKLEKELVILEAPYDIRPLVTGLAPGADETVSSSILLATAKALSQNRPARSVLFLFSAGNREEEAGARHFVQAFRAKEKGLEKELKLLHQSKKKVRKKLELAGRENPFKTDVPEEKEILSELVSQLAKERADELTRAVVGMKFEEKDISDLRAYRVLSWASDFNGLGEKEMALASRLLAESATSLRSDKKEFDARESAVESNIQIRKMIDDFKTVLFMSLSISSGARRLTIVENGSTYPLKEDLRRISRAAGLREILARAGAEMSRESGGGRPDRER